MTKVTIEYCGMEGTGKSVTAAKQDAARKLEQAMNGDYSPTLVACGEVMAMLWREPRSGWVYRIFKHDDSPALTGRIYACSHCGDDYAEAHKRLIHHVVDIGWHPATLADCENVPAIVTDKTDRRDLRDRARMAVHHRLLQAAGFEREHAWDIAQRNPWKHTAEQADPALQPESLEARLGQNIAA